MIQVYAIVLFLMADLQFIISDCRKEVAGRGDKLYVLSQSKQLYSAAAQTCLSMGGKVAQITQEDRSFFYPILSRKYLEGIVSFVDIKRQLKQVTLPNREKIIYLQHKYITQNSAFTLTDKSYIVPDNGELQQIALYTRPTKPFLDPIKFCWSDMADRVASQCTGSFKDNFQLYGATKKPTEDSSVTLFNYDVKDHQLTTRFSLIKDSFQNFAPTNDNIFIPNINVFIGANFGRSWKWENGSAIRSTRFIVPPQSGCQQMTWPLSYKDDANMMPIDCSSGRAYFVCEVPFTGELEQKECDGNSLNLAWSTFPFLSQRKVEIGGAQIYIVEINRHVRLNGRTSYLISDLEPSTAYTAKFKLRFKDCIGVELYSVAVGSTGYSMPPPVTGAFITSVTAQSCQISWNHQIAEASGLTFTIIPEPRGNLSSKPSYVDIPVDIGQTGVGQKFFQYVINTSALHPNVEYDMKIRASSCGTGSQVVQAPGYCINSVSDPWKTALLLLGSLLAGLAAGIVCLLTVCNRAVWKAMLLENQKKKGRKEYSDGSLYYEEEKKKSEDGSNEEKPEDKKASEDNASYGYGYGYSYYNPYERRGTIVAVQPQARYIAQVNPLTGSPYYPVQSTLPVSTYDGRRYSVVSPGTRIVNPNDARRLSIVSPNDLNARRVSVVAPNDLNARRVSVVAPNDLNARRVSVVAPNDLNARRVSVVAPNDLNARRVSVVAPNDLNARRVSVVAPNDLNARRVSVVAPNDLNARRVSVLPPGARIVAPVTQDQRMNGPNRRRSDAYGHSYF